MRTSRWPLSASQCHRASQGDLGLPPTILTAGFTTGTNPTAFRHPYAGSPGRREWAPCAALSQLCPSKQCTIKFGQASKGQISLHTQPTTPFPSGCSLLTRNQDDCCRMMKASPQGLGLDCLGSGWIGSLGAAGSSAKVYCDFSSFLLNSGFCAPRCTGGPHTSKINLNRHRSGACKLFFLRGGI